jgi:ubiquinone/menaquinone biosynthesis C-methylase UbiE
MNHADHVRLLRDGIHVPDGAWADLGSGHGAFTLALAELLGAQGRIYSVDLSVPALQAQQRAMRERFPHVMVDYRVADFTHRLDLPLLDGVIMANALHFVREKEPVLRLIQSYLKEDGRLVLVEYNTDRGNHWVPYPLSYPAWERVAQASGFVRTRLLYNVPSSFLGQFYSACSEKRREG